MSERRFGFSAGEAGQFRIERIEPVRGDGLPGAPCLEVAPLSAPPGDPAPRWRLRGAISNERYATRAEKTALAGSPPLGRPEATGAALIAIKKSDAWWGLAQDERRRIFEEQSRHIAIGAEYVPGVARRLHHCRDLDEPEPFDFVTWFEFAAESGASFDELVTRLRETEEWSYVEREVEVRLSRL